MIQVKNIIHEDGKSKEELLNNYQIKKTEIGDLIGIFNIVKNCMGSPFESVLDFFEKQQIKLTSSLKVIDNRDNKIYGLLLFSNMKIQGNTPLHPNTYLYKATNNCIQENGFLLLLDDRLRNNHIDNELFKMAIEDYKLLEEIDFLWCGVDRKLKSHNYWLKRGFYKLFEDCQTVFYGLPINRNKVKPIFMVNEILQKHENYHNRINGKETNRVSFKGNHERLF